MSEVLRRSARKAIVRTMYGIGPKIEKGRKESFRPFSKLCLDGGAVRDAVAVVVVYDGLASTWVNVE